MFHSIKLSKGHFSNEAMIKMLRCMCRNGKYISGSFTRQFSVKSCSQNTSCATRPFEEISISVPWGHIAGKWYGPTNMRPIVGLHGWQDNAGTFDRLAPLLDTNVGFLSLDLPGHGHSSWFPPGMSYHTMDNISILLRVMDTFKWDKISLLCHSMSSINGFMFSAFFPDRVDMMVGLDNLKPGVYSSKNVVDFYKKCLKKAMLREQQMNSEPPCYEWHQLVERLHNGTKQSVNKETCEFLLKRGVQPSQHQPHKYYFSRDSRLKHLFFHIFSEEVPLEMAQRITSPYLFIKALQSSHNESNAALDQTLEILRRNNNFEYHEVEGSHHFHLNEPERVAPIINSFISKWRFS
ncbi:probable serine hydrolase [Eurosta solidaginis]|uniref:probable serine hydrolase n=1 Tax=Eurosta solidaginis TaxID=178769 RepID=UPI003530F4AA